jgi:MoaA/NifB/PqqE/SkfB family radical SAM enzyme
LSFENFERFLALNPTIKRLELSNYGEVVLNPDLPRILALARELKVKVYIKNGLNLNHLSEEMAEALVRYRVRGIKVSIDGASQQTYAQYRVGGNLEQVLANIRTINAYKAQYQSPYPALKWQFIAFGHNEHELPLARQMAAELGMAFKVKLNYQPEQFPVQNPDFVAEQSGLGVADVRSYEQRHRRVYSPACLQLWTAPQVNWDGKLLGCCVNHFDDFGNAFEVPLAQLLQSERYQYAKAMLLNQAPAREDIPCTACKRYPRVRQMPFYQELNEALQSQKTR